MRALIPMLLVATLALAGCGGDDTSTVTVTREASATTNSATTGAATTTTSTATAGRYPQAVRDNFITACLATSGGKREPCECALDKIEQSLSFEEFKRADAEAARTGQVSDKVRAALNDCL